MKELKKERFNLVCYLCEIKYGGCIQCDSPNCPKSFHVTCGQRNVFHIKISNFSLFFMIKLLILFYFRDSYRPMIKQKNMKIY